MSKSCPHCSSTQRNRIRRTGVYKYLPTTAHYRCMKCGAVYTYIGFLHTSFRFKKPITNHS